MKTDRFIILGEVVINMDTGTIMGPLGRQKMTPKETAALRFLYERRGTAVSRTTLMTEVWGYQDGMKTRTVDITVSRLRRKLQATPTSPPAITTIYGFGYQLEGLKAESTPAVDVDVPPIDVLGRNRVWHGDRLQFEALTALAADCRRLNIVGPLGVGKSRMAYELAIGLGWRPLWVPIDGSVQTTNEALASRILEVLRLKADSTSALIEAVGALPDDTVIVLDGLDALTDQGVRLLELLCTMDAGPAIFLTSRMESAFRSMKTVVVRPLCPEHARALFEEELAFHRPGIVLESTDPVDAWLDATDGLPGAIVHGAQQVDSRFQLEIGPRTADFAPFDQEARRVLDELPGVAGLVAELAPFPDGVSWGQAEQLWPRRLADLARLVASGLASQHADGTVRLARRGVRAIGEAASNVALVRWAALATGAVDIRDQQANLHKALVNIEDPELRLSVLLKLCTHLRRRGDLSGTVVLLDRELSMPCTHARLCARVHLERATVHQTRGRDRRALGDARAALRYLTDEADGHRTWARFAIASALAHAGESSAVVESELDGLSRSGLPGPLRARVAHIEASVRYCMGQLASAMDIASDALADLAQVPFEPDHVRLLILRASALAGIGQLEAANVCFVEAAELAKANEEPFLAGLADMGVGGTLLELGDAERAADVFAASASNLVMSMAHCGLVVCNQGLALLSLGRLEEAEVLLRGVYLQAERAGTSKVVAYALANLGLLEHLKGHPEASLDHYQQAQRSGCLLDQRTEYAIEVFGMFARWQLRGEKPVLLAPAPTARLVELTEVVQAFVADRCPGQPGGFYAKIAVAVGNRSERARLV